MDLDELGWQRRPCMAMTAPMEIDVFLQVSVHVLKDQVENMKWSGHDGGHAQRRGKSRPCRRDRRGGGELALAATTQKGYYKESDPGRPEVSVWRVDSGISPFGKMRFQLIPFLRRSTP